VAGPRSLRDPLVTSKIMASVHSRDTRAEIAIRRELHKRGVRYRLQVRDVFGHPDLVVRKYRVAVFVDGDLWHGNAWRVRKLSRLEDLFPNRTEWWTAKILRNVARDQLVRDTLEAEGWRVFRLWESDILRDPGASADPVLTYIAGSRLKVRRVPEETYK
jgi:DNA mismatch endonuclease (patch repair protein)